MAQPLPSSSTSPPVPDASPSGTVGVVADTADAATFTKVVAPPRKAANTQRKGRGKKNPYAGGSGPSPVPAAGDQKLTHLVIDSGAIIKGAGMTLASAAEVRAKFKLVICAVRLIRWRWARVESTLWCFALKPVLRVTHLRLHSVHHDLHWSNSCLYAIHPWGRGNTICNTRTTCPVRRTAAWLYDHRAPSSFGRLCHHPHATCSPTYHMSPQNFWTIPEVVAEIRDKKARQHLESLPFELKLREPSDEAMKFGESVRKHPHDVDALMTAGCAWDGTHPRTRLLVCMYVCMYVTAVHGLHCIG